MFKTYIDGCMKVCYTAIEVIEMAYTEAQKRATMKYIKEAYDRIEIKVPKGEKAKLLAAAESKGHKGIQPYILALIEKDMEDASSDD